ncbi:hypothetical protein AGLY_004863 [Aphis glycines]|uniref:Uncharacterized protein n=1 Tax=Aphis glycines TaxID=307491 RepID=A0A6G0TV84_APHGL|nr:hypothetical protein AGLY_004863 [Aphis glycines]
MYLEMNNSVDNIHTNTLEKSATDIDDTTVQFFINFLVLKELNSSNIIHSDDLSSLAKFGYNPANKQALTAAQLFELIFTSLISLANFLRIDPNEVFILTLRVKLNGSLLIIYYNKSNIKNPRSVKSSFTSIASIVLRYSRADVTDNVGGGCIAKAKKSNTLILLEITFANMQSSYKIVLHSKYFRYIMRCHMAMMFSTRPALCFAQLWEIQFTFIQLIPLKAFSSTITLLTIDISSNPGKNTKIEPKTIHIIDFLFSTTKN